MFLALPMLLYARAKVLNSLHFAFMSLCGHPRIHQVFLERSRDDDEVLQADLKLF